jgi:hypothetical protein
MRLASDGAEQDPVPVHVDRHARSCLTHPAAGAALREQLMAPAQAAVASIIGGDDSGLRAAVLRLHAGRENSPGTSWKIQSWR